MTTNPAIQLNRVNQELTVRINAAVLVENLREFEVLRATMADLLDSDPGRSRAWKVLCVDLTQTQSLNSLGLSFLYWFVSQTERLQKRTKFLVSSRHLYRIATFCRLNRVAEVKWIQGGTLTQPRTISVQ